MAVRLLVRLEFCQVAELRIIFEVRSRIAIHTMEAKER